MKRFLIKTFATIIILLLLSAVLDYIVCRGLLKMEDYRFQDYSAMLYGGMKHDVVIMGNSRGKSHYDTHIIDSMCNVSSFCIGIGGYPLNTQLAKLKLYLEHNKKPRFIIQNIDYMTFNKEEDIRHDHQSEQFFPLIYDKEMRKELDTLGYGFLELYVPMYRMFGYQMVIKNGLLEFCHLKHYISCPAYKGHRPEEGDWNGTELARMKPQKISIPDEEKKRMESYLTYCKENSIKVILVNSPMYVGAIKKLRGYEEVQNYFEELSNKYDFPFLDYTLNCPISQDSTNFCVSVHMNPKATKEFTTILCHDISVIIKEDNK